MAKLLLSVLVCVIIAVLSVDARRHGRRWMRDDDGEMTISPRLERRWIRRFCPNMTLQENEDNVNDTAHEVTSSPDDKLDAVSIDDDEDEDDDIDDDVIRVERDVSEEGLSRREERRRLRQERRQLRRQSRDPAEREGRKLRRRQGRQELKQQMKHKWRQELGNLKMQRRQDKIQGLENLKQQRRQAKIQAREQRRQNRRQEKEGTRQQRQEGKNQEREERFQQWRERRMQIRTERKQRKLKLLCGFLIENDCDIPERLNCLNEIGLTNEEIVVDESVDDIEDNMEE